MKIAVTRAEERGFVLHPALKSGLLNIYGWSSDEAGIRHALLDERANVSETEARLMLVLCSALLNYLIVESQNTAR
ncbi:hypothetical protein DFK10_07540 [Salibaculum griseiflavum]|uniref:Uncharacterized protein n=2 Tax=Salibaculum griseiflavum TaxID=1914409 RepID=A0A2V1P7N5_9RHOB|nr:hypothetical protein DFK10_07540 [Salibaculum griseiflavum]